ncbi:tRNA (adenosine(37)-N6)-threonylcarbamoyltransferase complex ATPase subunit type 1 TsaE [Aestuariispira insulae]|uniref:tRNA threonylcarbamoyladenosine biosynthesis protein TsaE n=1 Tax=Aestuariispira insulae TaxID=1461337 RepID=A0A3D9HPS5_9PROT|nr:tRNA (adenosine(37)-N6)-threonylcarbamoyltransferase complex ATPase subunit type 1 TsaE [Aestuariispira insulae]RED51405.1 tRNA threonylcarbamoyladenosine biosynthesis protein TsaE [Aestuariispira insulae]
MSDHSSKPFLSKTAVGEPATAAFGQALAPLLEPGDCVCLWGDLGMGKSTLARSIIQATLGADTDVPSPTFTLVQSYEIPDGEIWHMDLYRLEEPEDALELGIEDAFADAVTLIEWPDRLGPWLPYDRLDLSIQQDGQAGEGARLITLSSQDPRWATRLVGLVGDNSA